MTILQGILNEELKRLEEGIILFENELASIPKGSLIIRKKGSNSFMYRSKREKSKVIQEYIGKIDSPEAKEAELLRARYIRLKQNISAAKRDLFALKKAVKVYERKPKNNGYLSKH